MKPENKKAIEELAKNHKWNVLLFIVIVVLVLLNVKYFKYNDIKDVVSTLQSLSAAIFTIVGLWIGFLYPSAIQSIVTDDIDYIKNTKDAPRIEKLIYVIITSALVMLGTLFFYIVKSAIGNTPIYVEYKVFFKTSAFSFIFFMCWMQTLCIASVIISNIKFASSLYSRIYSSKIKHDE